MPFSKRISLMADSYEEAIKRKAAWGKTDLHSTGVPDLDTYLGGGYGKRRGFEIVLLFGATKIGKSTVALNLLRQPVLAGKRVGIMALEDDAPDIALKFWHILGPEAFTEHVLSGDAVRDIAAENLERAWTLDELAQEIESWFVDDRRDIIILDHIQMAFEGAESIKGENEIAAQRVFMRNLNVMMKRITRQAEATGGDDAGKTLILVSHINKSTQARGVNKVIGSSGIAAAATKNLEVFRDDDGVMWLQEHGSRHTLTPRYPFQIEIRKSRLEKPYWPKGAA